MAYVTNQGAVVTTSDPVDPNNVVYNAGIAQRKTDGAMYVTGGVAGLVPNSTAAATANSAAIQASLDASATAGGGVVTISPGLYYINTTLVIGSNTTLSMYGVTLKLTGGIGKNMLNTQAYTRATTAVTLTWSAGQDLTINWTAHGKSIGDYVWLRTNDTPSLTNAPYIGVFQVLSITNANSFVVKLMRTPTASPTGSTWNACLADRRITIQGGVWDYDGVVTNFTVPDTTAKIGILIAGVGNLTVNSVISNNAIKYAFAFGAINCMFAKDLHTDINASDLCKSYGPMFNCHIDGLSGKTGDDVGTFQTREGTPYVQYAFTYGDILNCSISNMHAHSEHSLVGAYCSPTELMDQVVYENIGGASQDQGIQILGGTGLGGGLLGNLIVRNFSSASPTHISGSIGSITASCITFEGYALTSLDGQLPTGIILTSDATVKQLNFVNANFDLATGVSSTGTLVATNGVIGTLNIDNCNIACNTSQTVYGVVTYSGSTTGVVNFDGCEITGGTMAMYISPGSLGTLRINFTDNHISGPGQAGVRADAACTLNFVGNRMASMSWGVVFVTGGTHAITLRGQGNELESGSWLGISGTPVISAYGWDMKLPLASLARTAGSFCTASVNTGSGGATDILANNCAVCDATATTGSWKQSSAPTTRSY